MDSSHLSKFMKQCSLKLQSVTSLESGLFTSNQSSVPQQTATPNSTPTELKMPDFNTVADPSSGQSIPERPKVVVALYKHKTCNKQELSFGKGDRLLVLDDYSPGWWIARRLNTFGTGDKLKQGLIPINYVSLCLHEKEWYFGKMSAKQAEQCLLDGDNHQGSYLIRACDQEPDYLVLSVRTATGQVNHYPIVNKPNGDITLANDGTLTFTRLEDLLEHYATVDSVDEFGQVRLTQPSANRPESVSAENELPSDVPQIKLKKLHLIRQLSWLSSSTTECNKLWYGTFRRHKVKTPVAIKTLEPGSPMSVAVFVHEALIMSQLRHPNIHSLVGVCSLDKRPLLVTEYMGEGDLLRFLRDSPRAQAMTLKGLLAMASHILAGMTFLEERSVVHRTLMARHCLVDFDGTVKVANFGAARVLPNSDNLYLSRGSLDGATTDDAATTTTTNTTTVTAAKWTAPEAMHQGLFSTKSDVWSFGVVLYEVVTRGSVPYPGLASTEVLTRVEAGHRMVRPSGCPESVYQAMVECWDQEPDRRPTFRYMHCYVDTFAASLEDEQQPETLLASDSRLENPYESIEIDVA